tara:strand:+ start:3553 stop:3999 length:447 start_codon:yes stop_codon:yes gene_type:complete
MAVLAATLYQSDLRKGGGTFLPRCVVNTWTGLHCPGCGNTRAAHALLHGDLMGAVEQNVLTVLALPFLLLGASRTWWRWMYPERVEPWPINWRWGYSLILIGIVVVFSILRNVPQPPFSWLAPVPLTGVNLSEDLEVLAPEIPRPSVH